MKALIGALAILVVLGSAAADARTSKPSSGEHSAKRAECLKQAKLQRFNRRFAARNRFMRECMARS
ncbi:hypothetical protein U8607_13380 [Methylobacterium durans]|uniref:hypothetical protein n=1 Tax=Methylobacterium durans TaxID=2202825 RepID=UPI002AFFEBED|nr:hypothetical protein [Methylobacterium durans]MEA1833074.1 hypothetical protein [Methylobacterium durans]